MKFSKSLSGKMRRGLCCTSSHLRSRWKGLHDRTEESTESKAQPSIPDPRSSEEVWKEVVPLSFPVIMLQHFHTSRCAVARHRGQHRLHFFP